MARTKSLVGNLAGVRVFALVISADALEDYAVDRVDCHGHCTFISTLGNEHMHYLCITPRSRCQKCHIRQLFDIMLFYPREYYFFS